MRDPICCLMATATAAALCLAAAALESRADERGAEAPIDWTARAQEVWRDTCQKCHVVPDATFDTDRAFLGQITETS